MKYLLIFSIFNLLSFANYEKTAIGIGYEDFLKNPYFIEDIDDEENRFLKRSYLSMKYELISTCK
jgi:hypothetical protein